MMLPTEELAGAAQPQLAASSRFSASMLPRMLRK